MPEDGLAVPEVLARAGNRWSGLEVGQPAQGSRRFNALRCAVEGISRPILTLTPRCPERDGLVIRTVKASVPPRVGYALTPAGLTLTDPVRAVSARAEAHRTGGIAARHALEAGHPGKTAPARPRPDAG